MKNIFYFLGNLFLFIIIFSYLPLLSPSFAADVVINEFVVDGSPEWVELYNASDSADYLKEYFIDDDESFSSDTGSSGKKNLINLNISNSSYPYLDLSSSIFNNTSSDFVVLFDKNGNVVDSYSYESNPGNNISIGRNPDGSGDFFILSSATKGFGNALPVATPTPTPSNTPTPNPTNTPTPTNTPIPAPTKTPTPMPSNTPTPTLKPTITPTKTPTPIPSQEILPTSILGESTESAETVLSADTESFEKNIHTSNKSKSTNTNWPQKIFIGIGAIFLVACAILFLRFYIKNKKQQEV